MLTARTDAWLLEQFLSQTGDAAEMAFEAQVRRHGPMVLRVCRDVLGDPHAVQDAFQATFLVLVRKASVIGGRELLSNWLYGVAHRTALRARRTPPGGIDPNAEWRRWPWRPSMRTGLGVISPRGPAGSRNGNDQPRSVAGPRPDPSLALAGQARSRQEGASGDGVDAALSRMIDGQIVEVSPITEELHRPVRICLTGPRQRR